MVARELITIESRKRDLLERNAACRLALQQELKPLQALAFRTEQHAAMVSQGFRLARALAPAVASLRAEKGRFWKTATLLLSNWPSIQSTWETFQKLRADQPTE